MADRQLSSEPNLGSDNRRVTAAQFERARHVLEAGQYDYAMELLRACCKGDPADLAYRKFLRLAQRKKYKEDTKARGKGGRVSSADKMRLTAAKWRGEPRHILEVGEELLSYNPWDVAVQLDMAEAADAANLLEVAIWILEQATPKTHPDVRVTRRLAELYEKAGQFSRARALWEHLHRADPTNREAADMAKDMAANETMARVADEGPLRTLAAKPTDGETNESKALTKENLQLPPPPAGVTTRPDPEAELRAHIAADPTNPNGYLRLAQFHRAALRHDEAQKVLQQGLRPTGSHFELTVALAESDLEGFRRVRDVAQRNLAAQPQDDKLRQAYERLIHNIDRRELDLYRLKVEHFPTETPYRLELGLRLLRVGQLDEAIRELQTVKNDPRISWQACLHLGHCFKARKNWRLAQRNFEEALKQLPSREDERRKELLFELATGIAAAGDLGAAVELAYELTDLHFDYQGIMGMLETWQERLTAEREETRGGAH